MRRIVVHCGSIVSANSPKRIQRYLLAYKLTQASLNLSVTQSHPLFTLQHYLTSENPVPHSSQSHRDEWGSNEEWRSNKEWRSNDEWEARPQKIRCPIHRSLIAMSGKQYSQSTCNPRTVDYPRMPLLRSIPVRSWLLVLSSALLQVFIFPTGGPVSSLREALGWIALVPFLAAILLPDTSGKPLRIRDAALLGYACGILWYLGNCYWIYQTMYLYGGMAKPIAFGILILFALYLGLYHALFAALIAVLRRSRFGTPGALLFTPFLWVAVELARARITGFPWDLLGYSQVDNLLLTRIAPIAGVMSISFVIAAVNAALVAYLFTTGKKRLLIPIVAAVLAFILQSGSPRGRYANLETTDQLAVMVQENLAVGEMAKYVEPIAPGEEIQQFSQMSLNPINQTLGNRRTIILWPEAPSHLRSDDPNFRAAIANLARTANAPAIIGSLGVDFTNTSPRGYFLYDSASLFDVTGNYQGRYDKVHLVPWGEYIPFKQFFGYFVHKLTEGAGDMDPGTQRNVFTTSGHTYGIFVCYESIFGDEVRQFANNGAEVLVNISDDGWYGDTGAPWQHLNMARMRAIENHRWLLRDTNTGVTTAIDPQGRIDLEAPRHTRAAYAFPFTFEQGTTFYTRHGDWFAWLCTLISVAALIFAATTSVRHSERSSSRTL
jgi:apolipoprotein N-acyltransferase